MSFDIPQFSNKSVMSHDFARVPQAQISRSAFRRPHGYKSTFDSSYLIPIYADEVLPGDTFKVNMSAVARVQAFLRPVMDNLFIDYDFFYVPNRLVWDNWVKMMGEQVDPGDSIDYNVPVIDMGANPVVANTLADYFGIPVGVNNLEFNSLHFRAYNLIYNEWYRSEDLQDSVVVDTGDGPDSISDYVLLKRNKRRDYFTSCLPWPQKGAAVEVPLGTYAPVYGNGKALSLTDGSNYFGLGTNNGDTTLRAHDSYYGATVGDAWSGPGTFAPANTAIGVAPNGITSLYSDLSSATAATINEWREAFQIQKMLERDARSGTRYTEILQSHFRVTSPDARLQRPEYLGGGTKRIVVDPVPDTTGTRSEGLGSLAGTGYANASGIGFTKSFVEHGVVIGLASVRADLSYQTGMERMWSRQDRYDFYWPALAHLGEMPVYNKEIYAQGTSADDDVFGYQERWADYRYKPSLVTGTFRSDHGSSLDIWHLSQDFSALPVLNSAFIQEDVPLDRVIPVPAEPQIFFDAYFDVVATRPMPLYSVPGLIDHF